ncbi:penicillin acylase family protein [Minwuia sp.]|uniref:penicillin acylase family protein n=1 Tax=Minwuia sp. TaxID=2493630 RepID=UPI003A956972
MKWIWRGLMTLVVFAAIGIIGLFIVGKMTLPTLDGEVVLDGPEAEIRIVRDRFAVPHIYTENRSDALFALGYVHAQDRLWQMEFQRRVGQGRLSEFAGEATLQTDIFLRTMGFYRAAEATLGKLDATTVAELERYAAGVNAWIDGREGLLPPEFLILGIEPEPWKPADTLVWLKMMALNLSGNWTSEALRARAAAALGDEKMRQLWPAYPEDAPVAIDRQAANLWESEGLQDALRAWPQGPRGLGSNNWVISGALSATGKPLLANDPHLGLQAPSVWYMAHVDDGTDAQIGATLPGVPFVVLGRNRHIAWGFTNTAPDVQDLIVEQVNPQNPDEYQTETGWQRFKMREEIIRISDGGERRITVRESRHGPILFDTENGRHGEGFLKPDQAVAIRWHVLDDDEMSVRAGLNAGRARDVAGFIDVMRDFHGAQQNMVVADINGDIGFVAAGRVPVRADRSDWQGMLPRAGSSYLARRKGFIPYEDLPQVINPARGYVVTANNRIVGDSYPHFLTNEWADPYRAQRITDLLTERDAHTIDSFKAIQADQVSLMAREFLPLMLRFEPSSDAQRDILADLKLWNGDMSPDRTEPTIFNAWYREFVRQALIDESGELFDDLWAPRIGFFRNVLTGQGGAESWCDDIASDQTETCADLLKRSFELAIANLEERFGSDRDAWVWGPIHEAHHDHNPFTNVDFLRNLFDIRVPVGGDSYTVNVAHGRMRDRDDPYTTRSGASLRAIYDLDDLNRSIYINTTGQSGNPLSPHYSDMVERWRRVDYIPMSMRPEDIEAGSIGTLRLRPAS